MNNKYSIYFVLVVPLTLLSLLSFLLHYYFGFENDSGLYINLATEIIGIIITIVFVNWIIDKKDKLAWKKTDRRLTFRLQRFITLFIRRINTLFKLPVFSKSLESGKDPFIQQYEFYNEYAKDELTPNIKKHLLKFSQSDWDKFHHNIKSKLSEAYKIHQLFSPYFQPEYYHYFVDVIELLEEIIQEYDHSTDENGIVDESFNEELRLTNKEELIDMVNKFLTIIFKKFENISNYLMKNRDEIPFFSPYHDSE